MKKNRDVGTSSAQAESLSEVPQMMAPVTLHGDSPRSPWWLGCCTQSRAKMFSLDSGILHCKKCRRCSLKEARGTGLRTPDKRDRHLGGCDLLILPASSDG